MKSNPAVPGGSLMSKPTWSNTFGFSATSAFLFLAARDMRSQRGKSFWLECFLSAKRRIPAYHEGY